MIDHSNLPDIIKLMKKNVYLIDLGTGTDRSLIPLGCGLISSYAQTQPDINKAFDIEILMLEDTLERVLDEMESPAVVGFACYVWHFLGVQELSRMVKARFPETLIVWGGPSIPQQPDRIKALLNQNPAVDILVHMEGEITFAKILKSVLSNKTKPDFSKIDGLTYRTQYGFEKNKDRERIKDFKIVPSPYLTNIFDSVMRRYGHFIVGILWETNRGCPFKCAFCDWGNATVNRVNKLDVDRVVEEIKWASERKIHYVYCTDANYGISFKRDFEITKQVVDVVNTNGYPNTFVLNWTKNQHGQVIEIADKFREANVATNTTISTQSFNPDTLRASLRDNIKLGEYANLKESYHQRGLSTYTELILPLPLETLHTYLSGLEYAITPRVFDQVMIYPNNILENTHSQRTMIEYGIVTRKTAVGLNRRKFKFERFGEDEIVVGTSTMDTNDWRVAYKISFLFLSIYNLRIAFYPLALLNQYYNVKVIDMVQFIIDEISKNNKNYSVMKEVSDHLDQQIELILSSVSSVSPTRLSDGVAFTPHEASTFIMACELEKTYLELDAIFNKMCVKFNCAEAKPFVIDALNHQKSVLPAFEAGVVEHNYQTNSPRVIDHLTMGGEMKLLKKSPTKVLVKHHAHDFSDRIEFNRRRVSSGYTLNLSDVTFINEELKTSDFRQSKAPNARNVNMAGEFIKSARVDN